MWYKPFFFRSRDIHNAVKKISTKNTRLLFSQKPKKFHTAEINGFAVFNWKWGFLRNLGEHFFLMKYDLQMFLIEGYQVKNII
jgi:hypothetical protein